MYEDYNKEGSMFLKPQVDKDDRAIKNIAGELEGAAINFNPFSHLTEII